MHVPPNNSQFWPFARFALVSVLLFSMLAFNYNRLDVRDIGTLITVLGGLGLFDVFKQKASQPPTPAELQVRDESEKPHSDS